MSINYIGQDEISRRKTASDIKNDTDSLTFADDKALNSRSRAYELVRDYNSNKEIVSAGCNASYYDDLLEGAL